YDESDPGTVLSQTPSAGTPLGDPEDLILIVSRGSLDKPVRIPDWKDYSADNAMRSLARIPLPFVFVEDSVSPVGTVARVTSQSPLPESEVGLDRTILLRYSRPESWPSEFRYGIFEFSLPEYPVPVLLEVIIREPGTEDRKLFSMPHSGGRLSFPYVVPLGTGIVVMVNGKEITRKDILAE
ncbi:MAG: penicillin-binding protein, partial [Spirochaetaceae bacterium]|nr:penicillin-binding protein [Spirochaetaceae bacterium]